MDINENENNALKAIIYGKLTLSSTKLKKNEFIKCDNLKLKRALSYKIIPSLSGYIISNVPLLSPLLLNAKTLTV